MFPDHFFVLSQGKGRNTQEKTYLHVVQRLLKVSVSLLLRELDFYKNLVSMSHTSASELPGVQGWPNNELPSLFPVLFTTGSFRWYKQKL